jgi:hypothetical protein
MTTYKEIEVTLDSQKKITITYEQQVGYSQTKAKCFRVGEAMNKRQDLLDIIEACGKELEVMFEHDEK